MLQISGCYRSGLPQQCERGPVTDRCMVMIRSFLFSLLLCCCVSTVFSQSVPERRAHAQAQNAEPADLEAQQRRAALRAALQSQRENAQAPKQGAARQLSPQERYELRQQLRQQ